MDQLYFYLGIETLPVKIVKFYSEKSNYNMLFRVLIDSGAEN